LGLTLVASLALCGGLLPDASYSLVGGQPTEVSDLGEFRPETHHENTLVRGAGNVSSIASGYRRPLDADRFRLAPIEGNPSLWVELREPSGSLQEHFVPPQSFVGRLIRVGDPGLRHRGLVDALNRSGQPAPADDAWLLIDGEMPGSTSWVFGVLLLLLIFAGFSAWGMVTLLARARR
jgi:hypothetical protein